MTIPDPIELTRRLVRCASVTPDEGGALGVLQDVLEVAGFEVFRADRDGIANLVARFGPKGNGRVFGFNGHTDVVPPGDEAAWTYPPFSAEMKDGVIWGRGATDMKSGVAAFVAAACRVAQGGPDGSILITVTGDEEGDASHGTTAILDWMDAHGERMDVCVVGEPSSSDALGDAIKIGRRGSMNGHLVAKGVQGHSAYPQTAKNPLHAVIEYLAPFTATPLDDGTDHFEPSSFQVTTIDCGNPATNVIPAQARANFNIRFNDLHSGRSLTERLQARVAEVSEATGVALELAVKISGESFLTEPGALTDLAIRAIEAETGRVPVMSTGGGTSDARFVTRHCPVVEVGLRNATIHQVDERVTASEIEGLARIYERMMRDYFAS